MYVSSDELRLETSIICRRGFLSQTTQIFYDFKFLFCRGRRRNVNSFKTQVLHIRSFFLPRPLAAAIVVCLRSLSCNTQSNDPFIFLPLLFLIVVSAPCCKSVTAITLCPLTKKMVFLKLSLSTPPLFSIAKLKLLRPNSCVVVKEKKNSFVYTRILGKEFNQSFLYSH